MKKMQAVIISLLFLISSTTQAALFEAPNPYKFGPQGRAVSDLRDFATPKQMVSILPNRPVVATDSEGNRVYYTPDGKMMLSVSRTGEMTYSIGGISKTKDVNGEIKSTTRTIQGSGLRQEIRNDKDQVIGYKELNGKGKTIASYDKDGNLTATYHYKGQGAKLDYVQNEMTLGRTYYDDFQRMKYEQDFDGYILKTYQYEDVIYEVDESDKMKTTLKETYTGNKNIHGLMVSSRDYSYTWDKTEKGAVMGDLVYTTTYYDKEGYPTYVRTPDGIISIEYHYKNDTGANKILDYVVDNLTKTKTYYNETGDKDYMVNDMDIVIARFHDGYSVRYLTGSDSLENTEYDSMEVTKYDINGKELYTTLKKVDYNDDGTISKVYEYDKDEVLLEYFYKYNNDGNKVIDYVINYHDSEFEGQTTYTWYGDNNKPQYVTSTAQKPTDVTDQSILKDFNWNGDILVCTFNRQTEHTQWYNEKREWVYEAFNDRLISKNIYSFGQLVAKWEPGTHEATIFINERAWIKLALDEEPDVDGIKSLIANAAAVNEEIRNNGDGSVLTDILVKYGLLKEDFEYQASATWLN